MSATLWVMPMVMPSRVAPHPHLDLHLLPSLGFRDAGALPAREQTADTRRLIEREYGLESIGAVTERGDASIGTGTGGGATSSGTAALQVFRLLSHESQVLCKNEKTAT